MAEKHHHGRTFEFVLLHWKGEVPWWVSSCEEGRKEGELLLPCVLVKASIHLTVEDPLLRTLIEIALGFSSSALA